MDRIDEQLVELLNRRTFCALEIGKIKQEKGLPIYAPERELQVLDHVSSKNQGPLDRDAIRRLFERIIDEARSAERVTAERESNQTPKQTFGESASLADDGHEYREKG